ncbi:MAG: TIGR04283 family arsenosugar biosynthesis glycosyltransferase [Campylobacteraceae bacterium]|nr:TIGR04283 family arsenosugar biosynthesis glycosyltransferase [Campylobacteraceae bacterium]
MHPNALIYFIKAPIQGKVKTRLAKSIGDEEATTFYLHCVEKLLRLKAPPKCDIFIAYDDVDEKISLPTCLENTNLFYQTKGDLGVRMCEAFAHVFALDYENVILVGSDIPDIDETILKESLDLLSTSDALLSPTFDGGYYLIGFHAKTFTCKAFENIVYSQNDVFEKTLVQLKPLHVSHGQRLRDIDTIDDLKAYDTNFFPFPSISVIIPVYHEDETLLKTIDTLFQNAKENDFEIIVVDTSEKTTIDAFPLLHVRTGIAPKGRANQMNEGALMAKGDRLLFLHADTRVPKHWDELVKKGGKVGAFKLGIDSPKRIFRVIETLANERTLRTHIPYGDQGQFFQTSFFRELGGYAPIPLMEDIDIMKRIKQRGEKINLLEERVLTSARRWEKEGIVYTTLRNRVLSFLYFMGVSPQYLVKRYKPHHVV